MSAPATLLPASDVLTRAQFDALGFVNEFVPAEGAFAALKVVGTRVDPCFQTDAGCELQVRLVLQPVVGPNDTPDSTVHLFFTQPPPPATRSGHGSSASRPWPAG